MRLKEALTESKKLQLMILVRSCSNTYTLKVERMMIRERQELNEVDYFEGAINEEIRLYFTILDRINDKKKYPNTSLKILKFKLQENFLKLDIFLQDTVINDKAKQLNDKIDWEKSDFNFLGDKRDEFWEIITSYNSDIPSISKSSFLNIRDIDILRGLCSVEDLALYQSINILLTEIGKSNKETPEVLQKELIEYYEKQRISLKDSFKEFIEYYHSMESSVNM